MIPNLIIKADLYLQVSNKSYDTLHAITRYAERLILMTTTTVKENWNNQIIQITSAIIQSNLPTKTFNFVAKNVFGVNEKSL